MKGRSAHNQTDSDSTEPQSYFSGLLQVFCMYSQHADLEGRGSQSGFPGVSGSLKAGAVAFTWAHGPIRQNRSAGCSYIHVLAQHRSAK